MMQPGTAIYTIEVNENGEREFIDFEGPSGLSDADIERLAMDHLRTARPGQSFPVPVYAGAEEGGGRPQAEQRPYNPVTAWGGGALRFGTGAVQGAGGVLDNAAELLQGGYNQTLGRVLGQSDSATVANQTGQGFEGLASQLPEGSGGGRLAGEIGATALLTRGLGGPVAQGAGAGAILSDAETPGEFALDVAEGGVGGKLGDVAARGARFLLDPAIEAGARLLRQGGTRLTPGQAIPALREFEDKAMSWPFAGPQLTQARREGFESFATSVPAQALEVVQTRLPHRAIPAIPAGANGQQAIRHTGDQLSTIYEDIVPRLQLQADPQLVTELQGVGARLRQEALSDAGEQTFDRIIRRGITGRLRGSSATGEEYQAIDTYLGSQIARFGRNTDPDDQLIASGLQDIRAHLRNAVTRQNGQLGQELEAVDEAWSMLVPAEAAAANAPRGFFSPYQYRQALKSGDDRVRRRGMARGEVRGQEYAEAGQNVLPSTYPNPSGTAGHEAYSLGNMRFYQGLAARMFYNPSTQNFLMRATVDRPAALNPFARAVAGVIEPLPAPQAGASLLGGSTNALFGF